MKTKYYFIVLLIFIFLYKNVFGAFYFTEIMPNVAEETIDEYVQITYDGNGVNNLNGYKLSDKTGKEYIFGDDLFLPDESKKYYRPQTMVVLNNSDEEVYLKDSSGKLVDSFYYTTSTKGEAIKIEKDINLGEEIIEDTETNSGEIQEGDLQENEIIEENNEVLETNSGNLDEESNENQFEIETGSGELNQEQDLSQDNIFSSGSIENYEIETNNQDTNSGSIENKKINIDIKNTFQSPTYLLEKDNIILDGIIYNCDRTKDDCRVNFDFRTTFSSLKETDFNCLIDFGLGGITGEENKCNPNTIIFPIGTTNINIKISNKTNQNHFGELNFKIKNEGKQIQTNSSSSTNIFYSSNKNTIYKSKIDVIEPKIQVQSGLEKDNTCNKKECKINFLYEKTHNDLVCSWNFGENIDGKGNENKCNPNSVYFGPGKHEISLEICDENYDDNCKKANFIFENKYELVEPKSIITLQGKLSKNKILEDNKMICINSESCSINFDGSESFGEELNYFWDFGNGEYFEGKNPKSMVFEEGSYQVTFEVSDEYGNYSQDFFEIEVLGKHEELLLAKEQEEKIEKQALSNIQENQVYLLKISTQGKLGSNKILGVHKITCIKNCSINFDGSESVGDFSSYFWDFGNGETYVGKNPPYITYKDFGKYNVLFSGESKNGELFEKEFEIEYIKSLPKVENNKNDFVIEDNEIFIEQDNYDVQDIVIEEYEDEKSKDLIISIFIFLFLSFILGLFILKKYKLLN
ncbi:MAG: PKD domain-containing protein [Candidatus Gracilibacteria bacterium]|nr:PKD domain-containing protein [Candidatus Gracilibacteria bacterium]